MFNLIKSQGDYSIFFKSYLELECRNMVSILSFDSTTIQTLLDDNNKEFFDENFPLFYNNRVLPKDLDPKNEPKLILEMLKRKT